jgi:hypothetical protein
MATRMKNYLLHIARELNIPITIRRVSGGLLFWRSTDEDVQQAQETASRLQTARRRPTRSPHRAPAAGNPLKGSVTFA